MPDDFTCQEVGANIIKNNIDISTVSWLVYPKYQGGCI